MKLSYLVCFVVLAATVSAYPQVVVLEDTPRISAGQVVVYDPERPTLRTYTTGYDDGFDDGYTKGYSEAHTASRSYAPWNTYSRPREIRSTSRCYYDDCDYRARSYNEKTYRRGNTYHDTYNGPVYDNSYPRYYTYPAESYYYHVSYGSY
jgi:hypothetical protein